MKIVLNETTNEFIAKYFCDMSKAIATVGLASNFFGSLPLIGRVSLGVVALAFLIFSVILIYRTGKGGRK